MMETVSPSATGVRAVAEPDVVVGDVQVDEAAQSTLVIEQPRP
jgi:hypothetical protein